MLLVSCGDSKGHKQSIKFLYTGNVAYSREASLEIVKSIYQKYSIDVEFIETFDDCGAYCIEFREDILLSPNNVYCAGYTYKMGIVVSNWWLYQTKKNPETAIAETITHEIAHLLGLEHLPCEDKNKHNIMYVPYVCNSDDYRYEFTQEQVAILSE